MLREHQQHPTLASLLTGARIYALFTSNPTDSGDRVRDRQYGQSKVC